MFQGQSAARAARTPRNLSTDLGARGSLSLSVSPFVSSSLPDFQVSMVKTYIDYPTLHVLWKSSIPRTEAKPIDLLHLLSIVAPPALSAACSQPISSSPRLARVTHPSSQRIALSSLSMNGCGSQNGLGRDA